MTSALTEEELTFLRGMFDLARAGDGERLAEAVDAGVPVNLTNSAGDTLLILAAYHDRPDTVAALLERGADTGRVNDRRQTALGAAVFRRSERSVRLLLAAGADPALGARSALDVARFFDLPEMLALLEAPVAPSPETRAPQPTGACRADRTRSRARANSPAGMISQQENSR